MDSRICEAVERVDRACKDLDAVVADVQAQCPHATVFHRSGYSNWFNHPTIRICANCGLEEQGGVYASRTDFVALRSKFVADAPDITNQRIPHCSLPFRHVRYGSYYDPSAERED